MNELFGKLSQAIRHQERTSALWDEIFSSATSKTELDEHQKKTIGKIFRQIKTSENKTIFIHEFLKSVQKAILRHPRITRRVLEQMLPVRSFPKSIHKYSNWTKIAPVLDYIRYWLFGPPTSKFQQQLSHYSIPQDISILPNTTYLRQHKPRQDILAPTTYPIKIPTALIRRPRWKQEQIQTMQYLGQR